MKTKTKKPNKQRKRLYNMPYHKVSKLHTVRLDDLLMQEWGIKRIPLRKDDEVRVIKGDFVGVEGKVLKILKRKNKVEIEECVREKRNGATYYIPIPLNHIVLTKFGGKKMDPWRQKIIDRKHKLPIEGVGVAPKKEVK
ncbi:MAG: 50S ribosomal protein L24 [Promethearchaeota archaeon]